MIKDLKINIAAAVILYHPDHSVIRNIMSYSLAVSRVYVFDNTEERLPVLDKIAGLDNVTVFHDGDNKGIAARLNAAVVEAEKQGTDWLLTMDQDSFFEPKTLQQYFQCFAAFEPKDQLAMCGPVYREEDHKTTCSPVGVDAIITSGALLNLKAFGTIGVFDEQLFIDSVDHEYCVRARLNGYAIVNFSGVFLKHNIGTTVHRSSIKSLFMVKKQKEIHSPVRLYYMYRNMLYLQNKYDNIDPAFSKLIRKYVLNHIKTCILYGRETIKIIRYLGRAKADYRNARMGKIGIG